MNNLNTLAIAANEALSRGDQTAFNALYLDSTTQKAKLDITRKYCRKYASLNTHDVEALFDDAVFACVRQYVDPSCDFLAYLHREIHFRALDRVRFELNAKRRTIHDATVELVSEIADESDDDASSSYHVAVADDNTECEALLNVMFDGAESRLVNAIGDGKVVSIAEAAQLAGYRNRQQAHRALKSIGEKIA